MSALAQIPNVKLVAVTAFEKNVGVDAVANHVGRTPLARHHGVVAQVPKEVIREVLRAAVHFPLAQHVEAVGVHGENPARAIAASRAECGAIDALRSAVDRMRSRVARPCGKLFRLDDPHDFRLPGVGFCVKDVDPRGINTGNDQIAALHVRVRSVRAKARTASVPAEVVFGPLILPLVDVIRNGNLAGLIPAVGIGRGTLAPLASPQLYRRA